MQDRKHNPAAAALSKRPTITESEWRDLRRVVYDSAGIKMSEAKRVFLVSRLWKRLRETKTHSFRDYFKLIAATPRHSGEHQELINAVTTNKTDFFREAAHFDKVVDWLNTPSPEVQQARLRGLRIWSAAASTGEEAYSLAAVLQQNLTPYEFSRATILASDIDTQVLSDIGNAVYSGDAVKAVPRNLQSQMFVAGHGSYEGMYRVRRELRERVTVQQLNLTAPLWPVEGSFDLVFCRNVLIYFDRVTQEQVIRRLLSRVESYGLLFLGHAESLNGLGVAAEYVAHAVYRPIGERGRRTEGAANREHRKSCSVVAPIGVVAADTELMLGEFRKNSRTSVALALENSLVILLCCERSRSVAIGHFSETDQRNLVDEIQRAMSTMDLRGNIGCRVKIVGTTQESCRIVAGLVADHGMSVVVSKVVPNGTSVRILAESERIGLWAPTPISHRSAMPDASGQRTDKWGRT